MKPLNTRHADLQRVFDFFVRNMLTPAAGKEEVEDMNCIYKKKVELAVMPPSLNIRFRKSLLVC